ncbi:uncharacterized protein LOC120314535 [Crotalus tigris]|uniref:uncharacterized protein LOC120314535 n=1 Tax=Crotalus tigris TaxID=88082 RepID=UPI00192F29DE|nr:uncharacterized protein LOC120314535 [Crotalus tigris]
MGHRVITLKVENPVCTCWFSVYLGSQTSVRLALYKPTWKGKQGGETHEKDETYGIEETQRIKPSRPTAVNPEDPRDVGTGTGMNVKEDTINESGEESQNGTRYSHIERNAVTDPERKMRPPHSTRTTEVGGEVLQNVNNDRPVNVSGEKEREKSKLKRRERQGEEISGKNGIGETDEEQRNGPSRPTAVNPEALPDVHIDINSVKKKREAEKKHCGHQDERDLTNDPPGPITRSRTRAKQLDIMTTKKLPPPTTKQPITRPRTVTRSYLTRNNSQVHPDESNVKSKNNKIKRENHQKDNWIRDNCEKSMKHALPSNPKEEPQYRKHRSNRDPHLTTPELKEGKKMDEEKHVIERNRKKQISPRQLDQLAPMTRSRSRAQAMTYL